jgi:hypothetical protein
MSDGSENAVSLARLAVERACDHNPDVFNGTLASAEDIISGMEGDADTVKVVMEPDPEDDLTVRVNLPDGTSGSFTLAELAAMLSIRDPVAVLAAIAALAPVRIKGEGW